MSVYFLYFFLLNYLLGNLPLLPAPEKSSKIREIPHPRQLSRCSHWNISHHLLSCKQLVITSKKKKDQCPRWQHRHQNKLDSGSNPAFLNLFNIEQPLSKMYNIYNLLITGNRINGKNYFFYITKKIIGDVLKNKIKIS